jgi:hypothetical protein
MGAIGGDGGRSEVPVLHPKCPGVGLAGRTPTQYNCPGFNVTAVFTASFNGPEGELGMVTLPEASRTLGNTTSVGGLETLAKAGAGENFGQTDPLCSSLLQSGLQAQRRNSPVSTFLQNQFEQNVITTNVDYVFNWARKSALWPLTFGLACCAIEMIASSTSRFDIARFGA